MIKKNKTLTIAMLISVVAIYGTIVYKSVANTQLEVDKSNVNVFDLNYNIVNYKKDDFEILNRVKDPFNGKIMPRNVAGIKSIEQPKLVVQNKKPLKPIIKQWPPIKYYGFVKNTSSKNKGLCLVTINHQLVKIQKGAMHSGVTIVDVFKDSILVSSDQEFKTVVKE